MDAALATALVAERFPEWAGLPVTPVVPGGHDNRTFRLGDELTVRLPTADGYVAGELKEHVWLARLAPRLPLPIPEVVATGEPSESFPRPWSVRRWIPGDTLLAAPPADLDALAVDLARFLLTLRAVDAEGGPAAGQQSFFRGADPVVYDAETRHELEGLRRRDSAAADRATAMWDAALASSWERPPVWFHGDIAGGNLLVRNGRLSAVIDFGTAGVGDPACDLVIAWTTFRGSARERFLETIAPDDGMRARARGWALWKALITDDRATLAELLG